jgi:hypothetical protein
VIERLLLNRIDTKTARPAIGVQDNLVILAGPDKTQPLLAIPEFAKTRTHLALHPAIFKLAPVLGGLFAVIVRFRLFRPIPGSY